MILKGAVSVLRAFTNSKLSDMTRAAYNISQITADSSGNRPVNVVTHREKATTIKTFTKPKSNNDDYQLIERWEQVVIFMLRTGHSRHNAHMCTKLKQLTPPVWLWPGATGSRVHFAAMLTTGVYEEDCVTKVELV